MSDRLSNVTLNPVDDQPRRVGGELRIEHPALVLASYAPRFAAWLLDRRGPWLAPVPKDSVVQALGGLDRTDQPRDTTYRADEVRQLADALVRETFKATAVDPRLKAYAREVVPHLESVADHVRIAVSEIIAFYRQAAEQGHGVEVRWHPRSPTALV
ncbi:MAG: hypothetical protein SFX73_14815 [Kofleriaceae bacterium]|nr:hypothetical protein [Kofleriaceae bacterium]